MAKTNFKTIDEYISTFPEDVREILEQIRQIIQKTVPEVEEVISYQIPAFKLEENYLIYFAGWKNHISLYPAPRENEVFKKELSIYKGGKGTVQFPLSEPIPLKLISKIVKFKVKEIGGNKDRRKKR